MSSAIVLVDYDPQWPILYEGEKGQLLGVIGHAVVAIEHVGSTAVPGLGAKPTIDIMVAIRDLADAAECIEPLEKIGYEYLAEYEALIPERRFFRKGSAKAPSYHLHMVELTSEFWETHLRFRDLLRTNPEVAEEYYQLKKELAVKYGSNRDAYTDAKTPFIQSVVANARAAKATHS